MKATSTIQYTFEDTTGYAETFLDLDGLVSGNETLVEVALDGENESIQVPLIDGYKKPYDWSFTDEIGTEHYIYYEELMTTNTSR